MNLKRGQVVKSKHSTLIILEVIESRPDSALVKVIPLQSRIVPMNEPLRFRIAYRGAWQVVSDLSPEAKEQTI